MKSGKPGQNDRTKERRRKMDEQYLNWDGNRVIYCTVVSAAKNEQISTEVRRRQNKNHESWRIITWKSGKRTTRQRQERKWRALCTTLNANVNWRWVTLVSSNGKIIVTRVALKRISAVMTITELHGLCVLLNIYSYVMVMSAAFSSSCIARDHITRPLVSSWLAVGAVIYHRRKMWVIFQYSLRSEPFSGLDYYARCA